LENEQELIDIGIEDYLGASDTLCVIEWPEKISGLLNAKEVVEIRIEHAGDNKRTVTITDNH
jgi:tRNA A37 threonylcarbamoyladenosine biosynthesis protein TsaE